MPEGDTIFRAARTLDRALAGRVVTRFRSELARVAAAAVDRPVAGRTVEAVRAVGKHLLVRFSGELVLRTHMRMAGSWHIYRPGERWQRPWRDMRLLIETADFLAVGFLIAVAELKPAPAVDAGRELGRLGPDLLAEHFDAARAVPLLRAAGDREIAEVLLDQSVIAGAGNVFKSETLFLCGVSPLAPTSRLTDQTLSALLCTARHLLAASARTGRRPRAWVYGRAGQPCRKCGTAIGSRKQGPHARTTYFCPRCQSTGTVRR